MLFRFHKKPYQACSVVLKRRRQLVKLGMITKYTSERKCFSRISYMLPVKDGLKLNPLLLRAHSFGTIPVILIPVYE